MNGQINWSQVYSYSYKTSKEKQWYIKEHNKLVYSLGSYGVRAFDVSDELRPCLIRENQEPVAFSKWARSLYVYNDVLYVATRQGTKGRDELFVPDYRFRFEGGLSDFDTSYDEFDRIIKFGGRISSNELGDPDYNFGLNSLNMISSSDVKENSGLIILKGGEEVDKQFYSSLWLKVNSIGKSPISIPLRMCGNETVLSLSIIPICNTSFSVSLSHICDVVSSQTFMTEEWICFKILANAESSKLWWRTKELGDWDLIQEGNGIGDFNAISIGLCTNEPGISLQIDDYYCHSAEIDSVSYVNGTLELFDNMLSPINRLYSDIKLVSCKVTGNILVVTGLWGFNIYDITNKSYPILLSAHRDTNYTEYQSVDFFSSEEGRLYACFANHSKGMSIWDITNPMKPAMVCVIPHKGLIIDNYKLSGSMYTFDLIAEYPYVYSTFAVKRGGDEYQTNNDCRGIIRYKVDDLNNIKINLYPMDSSDWFVKSTDDFQPTVIRKYLDCLYINAAEKGIACYKIVEDGELNYIGLIPSGMTIKAFDISEGRIYAGHTASCTWACFKNDTESSIINFNNINADTSNIWYTLDGHKLNNRPDSKGLYLFNGRIVIIR